MNGRFVMTGASGGLGTCLTQLADRTGRQLALVIRDAAGLTAPDGARVVEEAAAVGAPRHEAWAAARAALEAIVRSTAATSAAKGILSAAWVRFSWDAATHRRRGGPHGRAAGRGRSPPGGRKAPLEPDMRPRAAGPLSERAGPDR